MEILPQRTAVGPAMAVGQTIPGDSAPHARDHPGSGTAAVARSNPLRAPRAPLATILALVMLSGAIVHAQTAPSAEQEDWPDLAALGRIEVVSVSRRPVPLAHATAAVSVLTNEDLIRSGARSVAEALREVPGLMVGQIDANSWAIASRGFNSEYSTKMLVMRDGRSVYSPLLSLTYWDVQNTMMDDLDRIEVVRGPGSTQWGANAVNGVINIVTKNARDTQGALIYGAGGWPQTLMTGARYGGQVGSGTFYRVYGLHQQSADLPLRFADADGNDHWNCTQAGFRLDRETADGTQLTWQGDAYTTDVPDSVETTRGANTLGRFRHTFSESSEVELQLYYDYTTRETYLFETPRHTIDLDFQHSFAPVARHSVLWGLGYRLNYNEYTAANPLFVVLRDTITTRLFSGFIEDEIQLVPGKITLTPGFKIEHNTLTGWEPQPGLRLAVVPSSRQSLWAAVSRAVRTPGDMEYFQALTYPMLSAEGPGTFLADSTVHSEKLVAYEAGYRWQATEALALDLAAYCNHYDNLIVHTQNGEILPSGAARITPQNLLTGRVYGGELALTFRAAERWQITAWYALCLADFDGPPAGTAEIRRTKDRIPTHQAHLRSSLDLGRSWKLDVQLRFVDRVEDIPAYLEADLRLACSLSENLELSLVGQNLLHDKHAEFRQAASAAHASVPRGFYATLTWRH